MPYSDPEKQREYQKRFYHRRREKFFSDKQCEWCSSIEELELHHLDPEKKESHNIWSWSKERREKEIAKCIVLCKKCHRGFHNDQMRKPINHGTKYAYRKHHCKCEKCRAAARARRKKWQANREGLF